MKGNQVHITRNIRVFLTMALLALYALPSKLLGQGLPNVSPEAPPKSEWITKAVGFILWIALAGVIIFAVRAVILLIKSVGDGKGDVAKHVATLVLCAIAIVIIVDPDGFLNALSRPFR